MASSSWTSACRGSTASRRRAESGSSKSALGVARRLRIVALTANLRNADETSAAAGFDGFLAKPFELAALEALLKDAGTPLARAS